MWTALSGKGTEIADTNEMVSAGNSGITMTRGSELLHVKDDRHFTNGMPYHSSYKFWIIHALIERNISKRNLLQGRRTIILSLDSLCKILYVDN